MKNKKYVIFFILIISSFCLYGQGGFWKYWQTKTSIVTNQSTSNSEKLDSCQAFLKTAQLKDNSLDELCAYGLLFHTYMNLQDYSNANLSLKQAESLASISDDRSQIGWVKHKQAILAIRLIDFEEAKMHCLSSIEYCGAANDSICLALSHEQAGSIYGGLNQFDSAKIHFEMAQSLLIKFASKNHIAAFNNNFANMYSKTGHPEKAIPYLQKAIDYFSESGNIKIQYKVMNNLGRAYLTLKNYDLSRSLYEECLKMNQQNSFADNLISNYNGLFDLEYETNNMKKAFLYLDNYYELKDSLVGVKTQREIADLELNYTNQQLELEHAKDEVKIYAIERKLELRNILLLFGLVLSAFALGFLWWRAKISSERLKENQNNLSSLTKVIYDKNKKMVELQEKLVDQKKGINKNLDVDQTPFNVFDLRILTDSDWTAFQSSFENVHPGYIQHLRKTFPTITESEERLFLFIKLKLNRKESAVILGISAESVKKTRNRLRKRLQLISTDNLENFILSF